MPISDDESGGLIADQQTSETDLFNSALGLVGANPIRFADDDSTSSKMCMRFYVPLRNGLFRSARWNFCERRAQLAQLATPPAFEFAYAYQLPADCVRVWEYNGAGVTTSSYLVYYQTGIRYQPMFKIEGRSLVSNDSQAYIVYSQKISNPAEWDPLFYQMVETWLASKLAAAIPKDMQKSAQLLNQAVQVLMPMALAADGQEGSLQPFVADALTWGRNA